jgi:hypothetical protein
MKGAFLLFFAFISVMFVLLSSAGAVPVMVTSKDTTSQDPLYPHWECHELGTGFPPQELIISAWRFTSYTPCLVNPDSPTIPNVEVDITNMTTQSWINLVYVADPETVLANDDGIVNSELAFNIDNVGTWNFPLIAESINPNLIFEPGEMWTFVIQDYVNVNGLPPSALGSVGLVGSFSAGDTVSSGSIIAEIIPEPATICLLALGSFALMRRKK